MKSDAATPAEYLASLPEDRRAALMLVRRAIRARMDKTLREQMQYGVLGYCVPHSVWPQGHHTRPELPLMYMGLSSQKNDMVVYMLFLHHDAPMRAWFEKVWKASGCRSKFEASGAGCCLRFKKVEDLSLDVIGEALQRVPVSAYLESHVAMLARIGKAPAARKKPARPAKKAAAKRTPARPKRLAARPQ